MPDALMARLNAFNAAHPWSHNDHYHGWVLRHLPRERGRRGGRGGGRQLSCLDVGCGTGNLARRLAPHVRRVRGIDVDASSIATAVQCSGGIDNVSFEVGDLDAVGGERFDVITLLAVLHHLPLEPTLRRLRTLLAPGGRLLVVGCYRQATVADQAVALMAVPANVAMGVAKSRGARRARLAMSAPTRQPEQTLAEIRATAANVLPGARIHRRLFWRYTLAYTEA